MWTRGMLTPLLVSLAIGAAACDSGLGPDAVSSVSVSPSASVVQVGTPVQLTATATTGDGTVVSDHAPAWRSTDSTVATVDQSGRVSTLAPGSATIVATVDGRSGTAAVTAVTGGGSLRIVSGDAQHGTVTDTLPEPLVVRVRDADGTPRPGIPVTFQIREDNADLTEPVVKTDADGLASTMVVLGPESGSVIVAVTAVGSSEEASFGLQAVADVAAQLAVTGGDGQIGFTGRELEKAITVAVLDRFGNNIRDSVVAWVVTAGGGAPSVPTSVANDSGPATVRWTLGGSPGTNTMEARVAGVAPLALSALAVVTGPGTLTFSPFPVALGSVITTMQPDGTQQMPLPGSVTGDVDGDWSKDRTRLALANAAEDPSQASGFNDFTDLVVMNAGGSGRTRLTNHFGSVSGPTWSPDGSKIAFASDQSGRSEIYVVHADGSNLVQLTTTGGDAPSWSPDGTRIAVGIRITELQQPSAFVMDADDGGNIVPLMPGEDPAWSPDGSVIALATCPTVVCDPEGYRLTLIHPDGTGAVTLDAVTGAHEPAWAPDGSRIAVRRAFPGAIPGGIYTLNPDGSGIVHLSGPTGNLPSWGP